MIKMDQYRDKWLGEKMDDSNRDGKNELGKLWMKLREKLRKEGRDDNA